MYHHHLYLLYLLNLLKKRDNIFLRPFKYLFNKSHTDISNNNIVRKTKSTLTLNSKKSNNNMLLQNNNQLVPFQDDYILKYLKNIVFKRDVLEQYKGNFLIDFDSKYPAKRGFIYVENQYNEIKNTEYAYQYTPKLEIFKGITTPNELQQ